MYFRSFHGWCLKLSLEPILTILYVNVDPSWPPDTIQDLSRSFPYVLLRLRDIRTAIAVEIRRANTLRASELSFRRRMDPTVETSCVVWTPEARPLPDYYKMDCMYQHFFHRSPLFSLIIRTWLPLNPAIIPRLEYRLLTMSSILNWLCREQLM